MNSSLSLYNYVYKNAEMGKGTLERLFSKIEDQNLDSQVRGQYNEYTSIYNEAKTAIESRQCMPKGLNPLEKAKVAATIEWETVRCDADTHIAEMLMIGSNMGVINATKKLKEFPQADEASRTLMQRLLTFEEQNVQNLKSYL